MEQNSNNENLPHLPFDIIIKILNKLPVRSLFRFHCVCKSWRSLLQLSTREMSIHFDKICNKKYTLMRNADNWYPHDVIWKFKIPFELISLDFMLLSPVKGILCICGPFRSYVSFLYLWNPLTKEYKALPKPIVDLQYLVVNFGFGFVPKSNDFKVVRVLQHEWKSDSRIEIYSLNRDSWSRVSDSCSCNEITEKERDVSVNRSVRTRATLAIDLEKEVIIEANCWYVYMTFLIDFSNGRARIFSKNK